MTRILIIEGNPPDLSAKLRAQGRPMFAQRYANALRQLQPDLAVMFASPYADALTGGDLAEVDGVVFTGSSVAWPTDAPGAQPQRDAMEKCFDAGLPVVGSCNGMQLAAVVLGGSVWASPNGREIGLARDVQITKAGRSHPMLTGRRNGFAVPCIHRDEVRRLPDCAVHLAGNGHSPFQAFAVHDGDVDYWGFQYHPELSASDLGAALTRGIGIFEVDTALAADLMAAETDKAAAKRLGTSVAEVAPDQRLTELANWLMYVKSRARVAA